MLQIARRGLHGTRQVAGRARYPYYDIHLTVTDPAKQDPDYFEKKAATFPLGESDGRALACVCRRRHERLHVFR